jgi:hypothetical protein
MHLITFRPSLAAAQRQQPQPLDGVRVLVERAQAL